jgi:hypothetical protein
VALVRSRSHMRAASLVAFALVACVASSDPPRPPRVVEVDAGNFHTCVRTDDGRVECWGQCNWQCGTRPSEATARMPVAGVVDAAELAVTDAHACVRTTTGDVACWGSNYLGLLGRESPDQSPLPLAVPDVHDAVEIAIGDGLTCARRENGTVVCWGAASHDHETTAEAAKLRLPTEIAGLADAQSLRMTGSGGCARTSDGTACWSWSAGSPDWKSRPSEAKIVPRMADVVDATDDTCTCLLGKDGVVHCEGSGIMSARLADGSSPPVQLHDCPADGLAGVRALAESCALMQDDTVRCWGPQFFARDGGAPIVEDLRTPTAIPGIADAKALAVGSGHACVLRGDGALVCWGGNAQGQVDGVPTESAVWPPRVVASPT